MSSDAIQITPPHRLAGTVRLPDSKSIANRRLVIHALAGRPLPPPGGAEAADTRVLRRALDHFRQGKSRIDVGPAGTAMRFLTAYLALQPDTQELYGTARMHRRPIGPLVEALQELGARIIYLGEKAYPPLRIEAPRFSGRHQVTVRADISSQFVSALLLIGPYLPNGLYLHLEGAPVSRPYVEMTIELMRRSGVAVHTDGGELHVPKGTYTFPYDDLEPDWTAASYFLGMVAGSGDASIRLEALRPESLQGDRMVVEWMAQLGVLSRFDAGGLHAARGRMSPDPLVWDFTHHPDLAQTMVVAAALAGRTATCSGLASLRIKETDRIRALQRELRKVGIRFEKAGAADDTFVLSGTLDLSRVPVFDTYDDHRMAMALSMLAVRAPVVIRHPAVTDKSFPGFWDRLADLGFRISSYPRV